MSTQTITLSLNIPFLKHRSNKNTVTLLLLYIISIRKLLFFLLTSFSSLQKCILFSSAIWIAGFGVEGYLATLRDFSLSHSIVQYFSLTPVLAFRFFPNDTENPLTDLSICRLILHKSLSLYSYACTKQSSASAQGTPNSSPAQFPLDSVVFLPSTQRSPTIWF